MRDAIELISMLIFLVLSFLVRLLWWGFKIIVIVGVIFGAADHILAQAPVSWPQLAFSFRIFSEYLMLAFETATRNWLPLGLALIVVWTGLTQSAVRKVSSDIVQVKIAIVALLNYLEIGVDTEGTKELRDKGFKRFILDAWKLNLALKLITGEVPDDALTAMPTRLHSESEVTLRQFIRDQVDAALEARPIKF